MSIFGNVNVTCLCRLILPLYAVEFKKCQCPMSYYLSQCRCHYGSCRPVEFKKWPCCPVDCRGLEPSPSSPLTGPSQCLPSGSPAGHVEEVATAAKKVSRLKRAVHEAVEVASGRKKQQCSSGCSRCQRCCHACRRRGVPAAFRAGYLISN